MVLTLVVLTFVVLTMLGFAGVGRLIKFVPYPVVSGFLSAVGLILITMSSATDEPV